MRRFIFVTGLLCLLAVTSGCLGDAGTGERLDVDAIENVSSYEFEADSRTAVTSEGGAARMSNATIRTRRNITGAVDRSDREMSLEIRSRTRIEGGPATPGAPTSTRERQRLLLAGGSTYIANVAENGSAQWLRTSRPELYDRFWAEQEPLAKLASVLREQTVREHGEASVRGRDARVVDVKMNATAYQRLVRRTLNGSGLGGARFGRSAVVRNVSIRLWLAEDGRPLKTEVATVVATTRPNPGAAAGAGGRTTTIVRDSQTTTWFTDYDEPVEVTVPEEARNARTLEQIRANRTAGGAGGGAGAGTGSTGTGG